MYSTYIKIRLVEIVIFPEGNARGKYDFSRVNKYSYFPYARKIYVYYYITVSFFNRKSSVIVLLINPKFLVFSISPVISFLTDDRGNSDLDRQSAYDIGKITMI